MNHEVENILRTIEAHHRKGLDMVATLHGLLAGEEDPYTGIRSRIMSALEESGRPLSRAELAVAVQHPPKPLNAVLRRWMAHDDCPVQRLDRGLYGLAEYALHEGAPEELFGSERKGAA